MFFAPASLLFCFESFCQCRCIICIVVLVRILSVKSWGVKKVCCGKGWLSVLDPADKIPQDENKTKSSHGDHLFLCDSCQITWTPSAAAQIDCSSYQIWPIISFSKTFCPAHILVKCTSPSVTDKNPITLHSGASYWNCGFLAEMHLYPICDVNLERE